MPTLYRIAKWRETYETHETRKLVRLNWIPVPNKHDGLGFRMVAAEKDGAALFGIWNLLVQVASKTEREQRGTLERDGIPLTARSLATMTGFSEKLFQRAFVFFSQPSIGWLLAEQWQTDLPLSPDGSGDCPGNPPDEGKGREGKEGNGKEGKAGAAPLPFSSDAFKATWSQWEQHRREIRKPLTPTATRLAFADLAEMGEERATAAILHSISKNYQGIFEDKSRRPVAAHTAVTSKYAKAF